MAEDHPLLWTPDEARIKATRLNDYMQWLARGGRHFADYQSLWQWSTDHVEDFWESIWQYFDIKSSAPYGSVLRERVMPGAVWFEGSRLNFAEQV
ncbi:MAG: acetyl-coenzyme A synthetase N-terminal domain-containing protein, partial [Burkholderiaceae bacterium]